MDIVYNPSVIADRIAIVAEFRKISKRKMLLSCGFGENTVEQMKGSKGSMPSASKLATIADALGCSVDYLLGRTDEMLIPGSGQAPVELPPAPEEEGQQQSTSSKSATDMLALFSQLPGYEQERLIGRLQLMVEQLQAGDADKGESSGSSVARAM